MPPNQQPTLPPEIQLTDVEQLFLAEQPRNLWPTNQNSNLGALRKSLTLPYQDALDTLTELFNESFVETAIGYLGRWEDQVGLPRAPTGYPDDKRRDRITVRRQIGLFTRTRRKQIVESFISATFGISASFGSEGIALTGSGTPLYADTAAITTLYAIVEDIPNFSYQVRIKNTITPDMVSLNRELAWMTPAGISFSVVSVAVP